MSNLPSLYELLAQEKRVYDARRKSARAFYKFYGTRNVKANSVNFTIDKVEYVMTGYDLLNYRFVLKPLITGQQIIKEF